MLDEILEKGLKIIVQSIQLEQYKGTAERSEEMDKMKGDLNKENTEEKLI